MPLLTLDKQTRLRVFLPPAPVAGQVTVHDVRASVAGRVEGQHLTRVQRNRQVQPPRPVGELPAPIVDEESVGRDLVAYHHVQVRVTVYVL